MGRGRGKKWSKERHGNGARMGMEMWREEAGGQEERWQMEEAEPLAANASGQDGDGGWQRSRARVGAGWRDGGMGRESGGGSGAGV